MLQKNSKWTSEENKANMSWDGVAVNLGGTGRASLERKESEGVSHLPSCLPLSCQLESLWAVMCSHPAVILVLLMEKVGLRVRPSQDSGWEECDKEYSLTPITSWRCRYVPPHRCLITLQWKNQQDDGIFLFPLLPSFLWGLDLANDCCASRLAGDDQDPQCLPQERTTGGTHLQRRARENSRMFSPSTFCDLLHVDAKFFEWRASQGRFIRRAKGSRRKHRGCTHTDRFWHLTNNIDFCPCCYLMRLDLTRHWKKFERGPGGGPCDAQSQLGEWLLTGMPQRLTLSRADASEPETCGQTPFKWMTPFPFGGGIWNYFSDLLDLVFFHSFFLFFFFFKCTQLNYLYFLLKQILLEKHNYPHSLTCPVLIDKLLKFFWNLFAKVGHTTLWRNCRKGEILKFKPLNHFILDFRPLESCILIPVWVCQEGRGPFKAILGVSWAPGSSEVSSSLFCQETGREGKTYWYGHH